jgi:hypothetical protein
MSKVAAILRAHELARAQKVRRKHTHVETISEDDRSAREYAAFQHDCVMDEFNDIPDRLGKTGNYEPASIYSPAPPSRFQRIAPRKRNAGEREDRGAGDNAYQPPREVRVPSICSRRHRTMVTYRTMNIPWEQQKS